MEKIGDIRSTSLHSKYVWRPTSFLLSFLWLGLPTCSHCPSDNCKVPAKWLVILDAPIIVHSLHDVYITSVTSTCVCVCVCVCVRSRRLLYADCGNTLSTVRACNLSAGNCEILMSRTHCVHDLRFDADINALYWIEANNIRRRYVGGRVEFLTSVFLDLFSKIFTMQWLNLTVNAKKSAWRPMHIGHRFNVSYSNMTTIDRHKLTWCDDDIRYLGIFVTAYREYRCLYD